MSSSSESTTKPTVYIDNLSKNFGSVVALNKLNLQIEAGEVHGLLGPNGAGKSTTIRVLLGLLRRDGGSCEIFGLDVWSNTIELHQRMAYVPGDVNLWESLTGGEIIDLLGQLRKKPTHDRRQELIERFQLDPTKKFRTYSKGNRQKVALIAALSADVELYIFDEPTSGLDPLLELVFQDEVRKLKSAGKTILLSSHILAEVEALCDKVTIISDGSVVESGTLDSLRHLANTTIKVTTQQSPKELSSHAGVSDFVIDGRHAEFQVSHKHLNEVMEKLVALRIEAITSHPPTLEELFMSHYEKRG